MIENNGLKVVYTFFLGLILAIFVGVGVNTFYPGPEYPESPSYVYDSELSEADKQKEKDYQQKMDEYQDKEQNYSRNVSVITLLAGVILLSVSLIYEKRIRLIADGILLGGLFTLLYSIIRGFSADDSKFLFIAVSVGVVVALYLGYHRFVKPEKPSSSRKKAAKKRK